MKRIILLLAAVLMATPAVAQQQKKPIGIGVRAGFSVDPDQFVVGTQAVVGRIAKVARFVPSFDLGFGNDVTTFTFNADAVFRVVPLPNSEAAFVLGVGPTLTHWSFDGFSDTEIGLSISPALRMPMGTKNVYNLEARIGIGDIPDIKVLFGVIFSGR